MKKWMDVVLDYLLEYIKKLFEKIAENPIRNILVLIFSLYVMFAFAEHFYQYFSIFTLIGYTIICLKGITKIIDDPRRVVIWAVGCIIGFIALKIAHDNLIPIISFKDLTSVIGMIIILYVVIVIFLKSRELKSY